MVNDALDTKRNEGPITGAFNLVAGLNPPSGAYYMPRRAKKLDPGKARIVVPRLRKVSRLIKNSGSARQRVPIQDDWLATTVVAEAGRPGSISDRRCDGS